MTTTTYATDAPALTTLDRCDRCGAQAFVQVLLATGDLLFCSHHFRENEAHLRSLEPVVRDETYKLILAETTKNNSSRP